MPCQGGAEGARGAAPAGRMRPSFQRYARFEGAARAFGGRRRPARSLRDRPHEEDRSAALQLLPQVAGPRRRPDPGCPASFQSMRRLRRLSALVVQLLTVQLVTAGGSSGCQMPGAPMHETHHVAASEAAQSAPLDAAYSGQGPRNDATTGAPTPSSGSRHERSHDGSHCDQACLPGACAAGSHCSRSPAGVATAGLRVFAEAHARARQDDVPLSFATRPEPPPPRA